MTGLEIIEGIFPPPIHLSILSPDFDDLDFEMMNETLRNIKNVHNESCETKINDIFLKEDFDIDPGTFKICIGKEVIIAGEFSDYNLNGIMNLVEGVVTLYHDKIIEQQDKNLDKLYELEENGQFLTIYHYHVIFGNEKDAFHYIKKASEGGSRWCKNRLRNYYRRRKNEAMVNKLQNNMGRNKRF